jgi:hypothetical protein
MDRWNCRDCHHTPSGECRAHERDRLNIFKDGLQFAEPSEYRIVTEYAKRLWNAHTAEILGRID